MVGFHQVSIRVAVIRYDFGYGVVYKFFIYIPVESVQTIEHYLYVLGVSVIFIVDAVKDLFG